MCSGGGALLCNVNKKNPLLNSIKRKLYVFLTVIFLSLPCFGEVPHSYVTDNPNAQVNKIETIKERENAELNLSVTKIKSKELSGQIDESNKRIILTLPEEFHNKSLVVVEGLEDLPNPSTVQGRKVLSKVLNDKAISNNLTQKIQGNNLVVSYKNQPEKLYVSDLNGNFYKFNLNNTRDRDYCYVREHNNLGTTELNMEIDDRYDGDYIYEKSTYYYNSSTEKGLKFVSNSIFTDLNSNKNSTFPKKEGVFTWIGEFKINEIFMFQAPPKYTGNNSWEISGYKYTTKVGGSYPSGTVKISEDLEVQIQSYAKDWRNTFKVRLNKYPKHDFTVKLYMYGCFDKSNENSHGTIFYDFRTIEKIVKINFKYIVRTLQGQSVLTAKEYYPVNQFINFNSTTMEEGSPLALENSLRDVSLTTNGKGIVTMQDGDKLEIDGKQVVIGAGGNLAEQKATIGNLEYTYKVENGKLRLALNKWGVLEPDRNLMIRVWRTKDGAESKLVEHTLTVKAPRRVEGSSDLTYDNDYQIRTFVRFGGISLTAPGISSLETPVPAGVALSSQAGQGIPFMNEGDILEVNDGVTRAVHQFTIGAGGTLSKKQIKFNNSDVTLYVENGKLRAGLNNWIVNKPVKLNLRLIRGTNEIMNHAIGFKVPEAPFNIKENGLLDFGRVTAGSKRTAETNIVLEMLNDVDSVKFNLKDTQPVMENANGKQLKVNEIQTIVKKQGEKTYLVKLHGKLIIPEDTQMGEYSGSTILELRIK